MVCLGEALVDILPQKRGETLRQAERLRRVAGGSAMNVTVGLARLGWPAAFLGKVGDDPFGLFLRDTLERAGVDVSHLQMSREAATGLAFAWVRDTASGEVGYFSTRLLSAERFLRADELDHDWLKTARALQFGSLLLAAPVSAEASWAALQTARDSGILRLYDVNLRLPAWPDPATARRAMLEPLAVSDIVKLNRHELAFLTDQTDLERGSAILWRPAMRLLIVTLDREGCFYRNAVTTGFVSGWPVNVVDSVGAGDAFVAALLAQILTETAGEGKLSAFDFEDEQKILRLCQIANAAGALATTRPGAIAALPTHRQLERFMGGGRGSGISKGVASC